MEKESFERLSISNVTSAVFADILLYDSYNSNMLSFASLVMNDTAVKELTKTLKKNNTQIYFNRIRKYLQVSGEKYEIIKKKHNSSDFNHVVLMRKDKVENIKDKNNDIYDFIIYYRTQEELYNNLYDKLYKYSAVPILKEWMPNIYNRLILGGFIRDLESFNIHNKDNKIINAKRMQISKEQLIHLISRLLHFKELSINNSNEKSDLIDVIDGLDSYLNIFGDILAERIQNSFVPKYNPNSNIYNEYVNNFDDSCYHNGIELYKAQKDTIQAAVNNLDVNDVTFVIGEMGCGNYKII